MDLGTVGQADSIAGTVMGAIGGVVGAWTWIRASRTPAERRFMLRAGMGLWGAVVAFLAMLLLYRARLVPSVIYWIGFGLFMGALGPAVTWVNRRRAALRRAGQRRGA